MTDDGAPNDRLMLTAAEAAEFLQVRVKTCRGLAARGANPAFRAGKVWGFVRQEIEAWVAAQAAANVRPQVRGPAARGTKRGGWA